VFLGWLLASEPVSARTFVAGGLIVGAVAVIVTVRSRR
jgi:drug/metabolite transporter (DMT)-like permease